MFTCLHNFVRTTFEWYQWRLLIRFTICAHRWNGSLLLFIYCMFGEYSMRNFSRQCFESIKCGFLFIVFDLHVNIFFVSNAKISPVIKIRNVAHILVSCNISCVLSQKCARASSVFLEKRSSFFIRFINCWTGNNEISSNSTRNRLLFVFHLQSVRAGFTWFESN